MYIIAATQRVSGEIWIKAKRHILQGAPGSVCINNSFLTLEVPFSRFNIDFEVVPWDILICSNIFIKFGP
ncbi:MAG: hypothetical protein BGO39_20835 [Chloroflexi bacterium 54-19]|nr:MAG: hypothetical protein BGO39_20835 [Chloroflexi bacterium 54-19]